jgi:hypothetical protein
LEGVARSVDKDFRLVRGAYPYVLNQLLSPSENTNVSQKTPEALRQLLIRLLTVNGEEKEIEWERLRDFLLLAQKASKRYIPSEKEGNDTSSISRKSIELLGQFFTSKTGEFLKMPLVHELAESIDGMASMGEANILQRTGGLLPRLPGMNGPVNIKRLDEIRSVIETFQSALETGKKGSGARMEAMIELFQEITAFLRDPRLRQDSGPLLEELQSVAQLVAVEVFEIRGSRAIHSLLRVPEVV